MYDSDWVSSSKKARVIAFYLPQFYPIKENDEWWGPGFTEWRNTSSARKLFRTHHAPILPGELGFYDLRLEETRVAQARLAAEYGVESFCYWHYWFGGGKRLLERPFTEVLQSGKPDFPFCLAWANQSWTGIWHGLPKRVLVEQTYPGSDDYKAHFDLVYPAFQDHRYTRVEGKPLFLVYQPSQIPDGKQFVTLWRQLAEERGLKGIFFVAMSNLKDATELDYYDGIIKYGPADYVISRSRLKRAMSRDFGPKLDKRIYYRLGPARYEYKDVVSKTIGLIPKSEHYYPCVLPNWDNTARSGRRGVVYKGSHPLLFESLMKDAVSLVSPRSKEKRLVFIKAWNEWAEGNYVEPDVQFGRQWLEAIKRSVFT